jgi:hypothetical protein
MLDAPTSVAKLALLEMNDIPTGSFIGRSLVRREDRRLLDNYVAEALQPTTTSGEDSVVHSPINRIDLLQCRSSGHGTKRTSELTPTMSAFGGKAEIVNLQGKYSFIASVGGSGQGLP